MEEDINGGEVSPRAESVGARLKDSRNKAGLEIEQVAAETRIPHRHLVAIEAGDFASLPSRTYAVGFTRTYARMLGLDEQEITDAVRAELADGNANGAAIAAKFEPGDPARIPGRGLAWFSVLAAVLFAVGAFTFYRSYFVPGLGPAPLTEEKAQQAKAPVARPGATPATAAPSGPVVFTANMDGTWVKFYDAKGARLFEAQMAKGDSFTVPADAEGPQIWTGRPYALDITVGGRTIPRLAEGDTVIKDVPVSAAALLARAETVPATSAVPANGAAPASVAQPSVEGGSR